MRFNGPKKAISTKAVDRSRYCFLGPFNLISTSTQDCFITELEPEITIDKKTNRNLCTLELFYHFSILLFMVDGVFKFSRLLRKMLRIAT